MTEEEWLAARTPWPALGVMRGRASHRKLRLLAVGSCRRASHLLTDELKQSLETAELVAEGLAPPEERRRVHALSLKMESHPDESLGHWRGTAKAAVGTSLIRQPWDAASKTLQHFWNFEDMAVLLRCAFGNPFRPIQFDPVWLTHTVVALAHSIYTDRAFDRMPILADALEEAGCDNIDLLLHCRGDGPHVRGCWVVDAILGKE